ncbi:MAG TPA: 50S ribosomal protein L15 [Candidatus Paceibacterota bacterium]
MVALHELKRSGKRTYRRVGRGQSSTRGKTSGRGGKGQTARAGNKRRPELRDIIKKLPKRRGYGKNRGRSVDGTKLDAVALSLSRLDQVFENGAEITTEALRTKGLLGRKFTPVKIVGGETNKKFTIKDIPMSASARAAVESAGGGSASGGKAGGSVDSLASARDLRASKLAPLAKNL